MNEKSDFDPALYNTIAFYSASIYSTLTNASFDEVERLINVVQEFTAECAPYRDKKGNFPTKMLPLFGEKSIIFAIAVAAAYLVWCQLSNNIDTPESLRDKSPLLSAAVEGWLLYRYGIT